MSRGSSNDVASEVEDRLLTAWRGEIQAGAIYELIARRMGDTTRAQVLRRMAQAESSHRERLERRMTELGIEIPDPQSVRVPLWQRLQARVASVDRLLAAREAAEDDEVDDLYKRPTGDQETDRLLHEIRKEERSHSKAVDEMRSGGDDSPPPVEAPPAQARLDRILGRERWHQSGGTWISGAIYGANDGLAAVFGIVTGVSGATGGSSFVLTAGLAGAVASALSMATGAFLAERSESEVLAANLEAERREVAEHPEEEKEELSLFYQLKGLDQQSADQLAEKVGEQPDALLKAIATEELGPTERPGNAAQSALAAGLSTGIGAVVPVIPFVFTTGAVAIIIAAVVSLVAHFLVGAAKSLVTLRSWWWAGAEMTLAGVIVGGATYAIGFLFPT